MDTLPTTSVYLSVKQVAERLGVSTDTILRWKRSGHFPSAVRLGPGTTRWRLSDVLAYEQQLQACLVTCLAVPTDYCNLAKELAA